MIGGGHDDVVGQRNQARQHAGHVLVFRAPKINGIKRAYSKSLVSRDETGSRVIVVGAIDNQGRPVRPFLATPANARPSVRLRAFLQRVKIKDRESGRTVASAAKPRPRFPADVRRPGDGELRPGQGISSGAVLASTMSPCRS